MLRKSIAMLVVSTMIIGTSALAYAATPSHICSYSYIRTEHYGTSTVGTHSYAITYKNGKPVLGSCTILIDKYARFYKCGCGLQKKESYSRRIHTKCGE